MKCNLQNEDDFVCGILRGYFVAFVKNVTAKFHSFGGLVAYKQTIGSFNYAKVSLPFIMEVIDLKDLVGLKT
jgi:hypothetical protein